MKISFYIVILLCLSSLQSFAQKVKANNKYLSINGQKVYKLELENIHQFAFYSINGNLEIIALRSMPNNTLGNTADDYFTMIFPSADQKIVSTDYQKINSRINAFAFNKFNKLKRRNAKKFVSWLLKHKVIDEYGNIIPENLDKFQRRFSEDIPPSTPINISNQSINNVIQKVD